MSKPKSKSRQPETEIISKIPKQAAAASPDLQINFDYLKSSVITADQYVNAIKRVIIDNWHTMKIWLFFSKPKMSSMKKTEVFRMLL